MILSFYEVFFQLPAPPKNPKGSPRGFLPRPLLRAGELQNPRRISKTFVFAPFRPFPLEKLCASHRGALAHGCAMSYLF